MNFLAPSSSREDRQTRMFGSPERVSEREREREEERGQETGKKEDECSLDWTDLLEALTALEVFDFDDVV